MLNIGRLGSDIDAIVTYYAAEPENEDASIPSATPSNASATASYYLKNETNGRWVGSLRPLLDVDGAVGVDEFKRLLEGRHPTSGIPLTPGAIATNARHLQRLRRPHKRHAEIMLSVADAASRLDIGERHVRKLLERGRFIDDIDNHDWSYLVGTKSNGNKQGPHRGRWKIPESEVNRFLNERAKASIRPGFDLTLRPPKSVSILWALGRREWSDIIARAHREAVDEVIDYYETDAIYSRKRVDGEQLRITTDGMIGAAFDHRTSRAGDPLLHTHVVTFNVTHCSDGKWRSLDGTAIYDHAKAGGYLYQAHLRFLLRRDLGVRWTKVVNGCAEIEGIPQAAIDIFSKRRDEIETAVAESGYSSAAAHQAATLDTRRPKGSQPEPTVALAQWWDEARSTGLDENRVERCVGAERASSAEQTVTEADVQTAFVELMSKQGLTLMDSTFTERDVLQALAERADDKCEGQTIRRLTSRFTDEAGPVRLETNGKSSDRVVVNDEQHREKSLSTYSTPELLDKENEILKWAKSALTESGATARPEIVEQSLTGNPELSDEQVNMVANLTLAGSRINVVAGDPGSGKTYAARVAADAFTASGIPVVGAALSAEAGAELEASLDLFSRTGRASSTIARLLNELDHPQFGGFQTGTVLMLDEASMVGTRLLHRLMKHLDQANGSLVMLGDPNQHGSVEAGGVYRHLVDRFPNCVIELHDNNRQTDEIERLAITEFRNGKVEEALARYEGAGKIVRSKSVNESYDRMVGDWHAEWATGDRNPMLAGPNAMRRALNERAREALIVRGELGEVATVVDGREFRLGDWVVARRNKRDLQGPSGASVRNGSVGTVIGADQESGTLHVDFEREGVITLPGWYLDEGHLDHAYARTTYGVQGKTTTRTTYQPTDISSFEEGYVALTRARSGTRIYIVEPDAGQSNHSGHRVCDDNSRNEGLVTCALEKRRAKTMALDVDAEILSR